MRIQIMELPSAPDVYVYALVFDGVDTSLDQAEIDVLKAFAQDAGAKGYLVSAEPVEVP